MVKIDGYEIFAELQRGPWIVVYKAFDLKRQQTVIVKVEKNDDTPAVIREQLIAEFNLGQHLTHVNLRRPYGTGIISGRRYLILEYVEGPTLTEVISTNLPIELCVWITKKIAMALSAVHQQKIIHRDVKPANIFLSFSGDVKLGDLGLAVDCTKIDSSIAGTPAYLSPETVLGSTIKNNSDLFSLGAVFYEMLSGEIPFSDHTTSAILHRIANWQPTSIEKLRPDIPPELTSICQKLLDKNPQDRCRDAADVVILLEKIEKKYDLAVSSESLSSFLADPEIYPRIVFEPVVVEEKPVEVQATFIQQEKKTKRRRIYQLLPIFILIFVIVGLVVANIDLLSKKSIAKVEPEAQSRLAPVSVEEIPMVDEIISEVTIPFDEGLVISDLQSTPNNTDMPALPNLVKNKKEFSISEVTVDNSSVVIESDQEIIVPKQIYISSKPTAKLFVENELLGTTAISWSPPSLTTVYELKFVTPGFPEVRKLINVAAMESDTLLLNLVQEIGHFEIEVNPWGEIWIDESPIDTTPLSLPIALLPGLHEVSIRHPQLGTHVRRIVITKGDTISMRLDLFSLTSSIEN